MPAIRDHSHFKSQFLDHGGNLRNRRQITRSAELESLVLLIRRIRETYALSVLLIGHTMRLVMGLSDRIIVLDYGVRLAEGAPHEIQSDARVIAAYLGAEDAA